MQWKNDIEEKISELDDKYRVVMKIEEDYITRNLLNTKERLPDSVAGMNYQQLSLFDDVNFTGNQIVTMV